MNSASIASLASSLQAYGDASVPTFESAPHPLSRIAPAEYCLDDFVAVRDCSTWQVYDAGRAVVMAVKVMMNGAST